MTTNNPPALPALPRPTPECQNMTVLPCEGSNACGRAARDARAYLKLKVGNLIARNPASAPEDIQAAKHELMRCQNQLEVIIGKNRNGEQGAVGLWHNMAFNAVRDPQAPMGVAV